MTSDFLHVVETFCTATVPILLYMWHNRDRAKAEQQRKHEENQRLLEAIKTEREWLPSHGHAERSGMLTAEGITRGPDKGNR
jgi:hypothetical protein